MQREVLTLAGPSGQIEARLELPQGADQPTVFGVACHPHSLKGGTMDNKVTHTLARAMVECGAPAFRFNFRGVGASAGTFDFGRGEVDDLATVVEEGRRRFPGAEWSTAARTVRGPAEEERCAGTAAPPGASPRRAGRRRSPRGAGAGSGPGTAPTGVVRRSGSRSGGP